MKGLKKFILILMLVTGLVLSIPLLNLASDEVAMSVLTFWG